MSLRPLPGGRKGRLVTEAAPFVGGGAASGRNHGQPRPDARVGVSTASFIRGILQAAEAFDPLGLRVQLDLAAADLGLAVCVDEIVMPVTQELRRSPATGMRHGSQGLMATEAIRGWLSHRGSFAPRPAATGAIVLACAPREREVVGLESMALLLRYERWPCWLLGARTSTFTLTIAAQAADAAAVVVMAIDRRGLRQAIASVRAVDELGIPVFSAGDAFEPELSRRDMPDRHLGAGIGRACDLLVGTLAPAAGRRSSPVDSSASEGR
jgi:hypothetical protein